MGVPLSVEPERIRSHLATAIEEHRQLIDDLRSNLPDFPAAAVGEGFQAPAGALAEAMVGVQGLTVQFMENRIAAWEKILELVDAVEDRDTLNAADLGRVGP